MPENSVSSLEDHVQNQLRLIRESMDRAGRFTALPGWVGVAMGTVGLVATFSADRALQPDIWLRNWLVAAAVAVPLGAGGLLRSARAAGVDLRTGVAKRFVVSLVAPLLAAAIVSAAAIAQGAHALLPALWLSAYGAALLSAGAVSLRRISAMGAAFLVLGAFAAMAPGRPADWALAAGFGCVHLLAGASLIRIYRQGDN
jgi:hypothetical protein